MAKDHLANELEQSTSGFFRYGSDSKSQHSNQTLSNKTNERRFVYKVIIGQTIILGKLNKCFVANIDDRSVLGVYRRIPRMKGRLPDYRPTCSVFVFRGIYSNGTILQINYKNSTSTMAT
jgi:hypothetical protein